MRIAWTVLALAALSAAPAAADKKLDKAVAKAEEQLQAPRDAEAPLALLALLERLGRKEEAAAALAAAGERAAGAPPAVRSRVRTLQSTLALREGAASDALSLAQEAVAAAAGGESLAALARAETRLGLPGARATAERAVAAAPASADAHAASGEALLAARMDAQAEAAFRLALAKDPRSVAAASGLALALAARGKAEPAIEAARAAVSSHPQSEAPQSALALALLVQDPEDEKGEALVAAQQATFLEPKNPLPRHVLGRVFDRRGQLDPAREAYAEAAAADPSWPAPRVAVLDVRRRQGDAEGALAALRMLPEEFRTTGEAELLLGRLLAQAEERTGALAAFERAALRLPGSAEVQALLGEAAYDAGELTLAADAFGRAATLDPAQPGYRASHALHLGYAGRRDEAVAQLVEITSRPEGQTAELFLALGGVYRSYEPPRVAEAVAAYEQAHKLDPKSGEAALGIARSYRAGRQWARAIAAYERVGDAFPKLEREALLGAAWGHLLSGDDTRARFYTGLAARAGANVEPLRRALSSGVAADDFERRELAEGLRSKSAGDQVRAALGLVELGRPAVPTLAAALGRPETSLPARERIVDGLARLGPAAREALPQLDRLAAAAPPPATAGEAEEARARREREARLADAARAAAEAIRAGRTR